MIAILKGDRGAAAGEFVHFRQRGRAVVGVHEVEEGPGLEFRQRPAQRRLPGRVEPLEPAIKAGDAEQVHRLVEEVVQLFIRRLRPGREPWRGIPFGSRLPARHTGHWFRFAFRVHAMFRQKPPATPGTAADAEGFREHRLNTKLAREAPQVAASILAIIWFICLARMARVEYDH